MTEPLALVFYEELMPGSLLVNRLQDLRYRVQTVTDPASFNPIAQREGIMLIVADLASKSADISRMIAELRASPKTAHIPIIAFADEGAEQLQAAAKAAGATLVVTNSAVVNHLPQLLEQALKVD